MANVLLVRHAEKGNGKETGKKFHLSPIGQAKAIELGSNLPTEFTSKVKYIGGSELSRSLHSALLIAIGSGLDPQVLKNDKRLGSENQLFKEFQITMEGYVGRLLAKCDNCDIDALRMVCTDSQFALLKKQIISAIEDALDFEDNVILGTHSPWLQIAIEGITGEEFHQNAKELDWIMINRTNNKTVIINASLQI